MYTRPKHEKKSIKLDEAVPTPVEQPLEVIAPVSIKRAFNKTKTSSNSACKKQRRLTNKTLKPHPAQNITDLYQKFSLLKPMYEIHTEPYTEQREAGVSLGPIDGRHSTFRFKRCSYSINSRFSR